MSRKLHRFRKHEKQRNLAPCDEDPTDDRPISFEKWQRRCIFDGCPRRLRGRPFRPTRRARGLICTESITIHAISPSLTSLRDQERESTREKPPDCALPILEHISIRLQARIETAAAGNPRKRQQRRKGRSGDAETARVRVLSRVIPAGVKPADRRCHRTWRDDRAGRGGMGRASQRRQKIPLVERGVHFSRRMKRILASGARHHRRVARRDPITAFPRSNREAFARTLRGEPSSLAPRPRVRRERGARARAGGNVYRGYL